MKLVFSTLLFLLVSIIKIINSTPVDPTKAVTYARLATLKVGKRYAKNITKEVEDLDENTLILEEKES
jgi:hypothetical protein